MTLADLVSPLKAILDSELDARNRVVEVTSWPPKCELLVILENEFQRSHCMGQEVEYAQINDPHYWLAEYRYQGGVQTLACKFGASFSPTNSGRPAAAAKQ
jgi:hypothetical protein